MEPEIRAAVGAYTELGPDDQGTEASRVDDVRVEAFADVNSIPADDKISVFALGLGGIAALGAGFARTNLSPVVGATIGTAALIDASGTVEVTAHADVNARINADGGAGSFVIGIGAMLGRIAIDSEVRARVGSQARVKGSSIRIRADNTVEGRTETTPSAGGILAGTGSDAETDIDAVTKVEIDERAVLQAVGLRDTETGEGGDIDIEAVSTTEAHATARGHAYGVIAAAGISRADAETRNQTSVNVRANAAIESLDGDVRLDAHAYDRLDVTSQIRGGAAIQVSEARADGQIGTGTQENPWGGAQIVVGQGARIAATRGDVDIGARLKARAEIDADGRNGGLGTGVDADADLEVLSWARTDIGRDVAIDALNIRIGASVYSLDLEVDADADSDALIGFVEATAYIDVASVASVTVGSGAAITGRESVVIEALHGSLDEEDNLDGLSAETDADADAAAIESANERAITVLNTETRVEVASGVEIAARSLLVEASADPHPEFSSDELTLDRSIDFNARVVLLPARSPLLVIDDQGRVVTNVGDTAVTLTADGGVEIGDIRLGDRTLGTVEFKIRASDHDSDDDGDTTTSRVLRGRPVIVGSNSFESVTIVNRSERYLRINDIAVQHRRAVESLAPAITGGISTSRFQATYGETTSPTKVVIEHTGAATAGVILAGVIDNAIGSTAITAMHGDISSTGTEISIHTGSLALSAAGDIAGGTGADPLLVATRILEADAATIRIEDRGTPGVDAVDIVRIAATAVHFKALKSIRGARGGSQAHIDADTIELVSVEGAVGEVWRALRIDAGAAGDALSIAAAQGIHVSDVANGLSIGRVRSDSGDIVLTVENTAAATDHLTLDASARIQATSGSVILQAGDRIDLQQGSSIVAAGGVELIGDATRSIEFALNAIAAAENKIWLAGHSFAVGDIVTYADRSRFGAIGGLEAGARYEVIEVDGDWIGLREEGAATDDPPAALSQGEALGLHVFTADDGRAFTLLLGRVDADGTVRVGDHGLDGSVEHSVQYRRAGGAGAIQGLRPEGWYLLKANDPHAFSILDGSTSARLGVSAGNDAGIFALVHRDADEGEGATIVVSGSISGSSLTIKGGRDRDQIDVDAASIATRIEAGEADDTIRLGARSAVLGTSRAIAAAVTVVGGGGRDTLWLDDSANTGRETATLTGTTVTGLGMAGGGVGYEEIERVDLALGSGGTEIEILGTRSGTVVSIRGGAGDDVFNVGNGTLDRLDGLLEIRGEGGEDRLAVDRSAGSGASSGTLTRDRLTGLGMEVGVDYGGVEAVSVLLGAGSSDFTVSGLSADTTVDTGAGADSLTFDLGLLGSGHRVTLWGGAEEDTVTFTTAAAADLTFAVEEDRDGIVFGVVTAAGMAGEVRFAGYESVVLRMGDGADRLTIAGTAAPIAVYAGGGADSIRIEGASHAVTLDSGAGGDTVTLLDLDAGVDIGGDGSSDDGDRLVVDLSATTAATEGGALTDGESVDVEFDGAISGPLRRHRALCGPRLDRHPARQRQRRLPDGLFVRRRGRDRPGRRGPGCVQRRQPGPLRRGRGRRDRHLRRGAGGYRPTAHPGRAASQRVQHAVAECRAADRRQLGQ